MAVSHKKVNITIYSEKLVSIMRHIWRSFMTRLKNSAQWQHVLIWKFKQRRVVDRKAVPVSSTKRHLAFVTFPAGLDHSAAGGFQFVWPTDHTDTALTYALLGGDPDWNMAVVVNHFMGNTCVPRISCKRIVVTVQRCKNGTLFTFNENKCMPVKYILILLKPST